MSKNRNRAKLNKAKDNKQYSRIMKNDGVYCIICVRRSGSYRGYCGPGWNGSTRGGWGQRRCKTWKHTRNTQWKE